MTEWRTVQQDTRYSVSDDGQVRGPKKTLKPSPKIERGRIVALRVNLGRGGVRYVHRLILEAFVGTCPDGMEGCHGDGDPTHNWLSNLRWGTDKENQADSKRHGTKRPPPVAYRGSNRRTWLSEDDVRCIRAEPYFPGVNQMLGRCFGVSYMTAYRIRKAA